MAHAKPIIATAVGGVPDLVTEDVGILLPPDDIQGLAAAMVRMAVDADMRRRMGAAARLKYEQLFTPEAVLPVLMDFYERVVRKHSNIEQTSNNGNGHSTQLLHPWLNGSSFPAVETRKCGHPTAGG